MDTLIDALHVAQNTIEIDDDDDFEENNEAEVACQSDIAYSGSSPMVQER